MFIETLLQPVGVRIRIRFEVRHGIGVEVGVGLGLGLGLEGEEFVSLGHSIIQMFRAKKVRRGGLGKLVLVCSWDGCNVSFKELGSIN